MEDREDFENIFWEYRTDQEDPDHRKWRRLPQDMLEAQDRLPRYRAQKAEKTPTRSVGNIG